MKNYMANKTFSRGTNVYGASASMVFVGNTDHSVPYMLKHSNLFDALPKDYYDTAFLDRIHAYLPGWEVQKLRNEMFTGEYGFIVDYLAEILKELRKEDHLQSYGKYFELSNSITTRDKDAITKTFSGLVKVIYPGGEFTEAEAIELIDFAIENRMRVKQQLIKMDETFEEVDFSYKILSSGKQRQVETLEVLEYISPKTEETIIAEPQVQTLEPKKIEFSKELEAGQRIIRDNQTGISYKNLFEDYLKGATEMKIIDPFVRLPYQLRNFMEFCQLVAVTKGEAEEVSIHLVTNNNEDYVENARDAFRDMSESLEPLGIYFNFEFDDTIHDRSIELNNGWKIILGRGLDIWQKTSGWYDIAEYYQEKRLCKACEITYLKQD